MIKDLLCFDPGEMTGIAHLHLFPDAGWQLVNMQPVYYDKLSHFLLKEFVDTSHPNSYNPVMVIEDFISAGRLNNHRKEAMIALGKIKLIADFKQWQTVLQYSSMMGAYEKQAKEMVKNPVMISTESINISDEYRHCVAAVAHGLYFLAKRNLLKTVN